MLDDFILHLDVILNVDIVMYGVTKSLWGKMNFPKKMQKLLSIISNL